MVTATKEKVDQRVKRIRARQSYLTWLRLAHFFKESDNLGDILRRIDDELNAHNAYGSMTAAGYAEESLEQLLIDLVNGEAPEPGCKAGYLAWRTFDYHGNQPNTPGEVCQDCQYNPENTAESGETPCRFWGEE